MAPRSSPSNPIGYGVANFLGAFGQGIKEKGKAAEQERQKKAYYAFLERLNAQKGQTAQAVAKTKASAVKGGADRDLKIYKTLIDSKNKIIEDADKHIKAVDPMGFMDPKKKQEMRANYLSSNPELKDTISKGLWAEQKLAGGQGYRPTPEPTKKPLVVAPDLEDEEDVDLR